MAVAAPKAQRVQYVSDVRNGHVNVFDSTAVEDPYPLYDKLRRFEPVYRIPETNFYLVSTWDAVHEATNRVADFSSNLTAALVQQGRKPAVFDMDSAGTARHVLATADDPAHGQQRKLVLPSLVAKRIRQLEPSITAVAGRLWAASARDGRVEWMSAMADRLPMTIVAELIGLSEPDIAQLVSWGYGSTELLGGVLADGRLPVVVDAAIKLAGYLQKEFSRACRSPGDNLLGDLARAVSEQSIDDETAVLMLVQLVGAGGESTAGLIGNAARLLALHDDLQDAVRDSPELLAALLEETLRLESPFRAHHRHVRTDTTLAGVEIAAGSHLLLLWGAANRDPAVFSDADAVRLDRPSVRRHLAFGNGLHFCVGAALARLEGQIALRTLLDGTEKFGLADAQWLPSIFVRRHRRLELHYE